ncbi:MAG: hypothetical protein WC817_03965 [Patescibacteria group bacterium]|jgi:hypothetical protein
MSDFGREDKRAVLEQSIIDEGRRLFRERLDARLGFMNNFFMDFIPEGHEYWRSRRQEYKKDGLWNTTFREQIGARTDYLKGHSDLKLDQTTEEFYRTIDEVVAELDTNGEIRQAIDKFCGVGDFEIRSITQDELEEKLIPVFARLIAMGYSRHDLSA